MARMEREKGKRGEREVVNLLKAAGHHAQRTAPHEKAKESDENDKQGDERMLEKDFIYKDMRVIQREDLYLREEAKKEQLLKDMFNIVKDTQKMKDEIDESLKKFMKGLTGENEDRFKQAK